MLTCADCSDLLLDYLYGLTDADQARLVQDHLASCAVCQQALAAAKGQQHLFSRAALKYREVPAFQAPAEEPVAAPLFSHFPPAAVTRPKSAPRLTAPARRKPRWRRRLAYSAAAAVLLAAGVGIARYHQDWSERRQALADASADVAELDGRLVQLASRLEKDRTALPGRVLGQFLHVQLLGPASYRPGASSPYRLTTQTPSGQPAAGHVTVRLLGRCAEDDADHVLFHEEYDTTGELRFLLPPSIATLTAQPPRLVVEVRTAAAKEVIEQPLSVDDPAYLTHVALSKTALRTGDILFFRTVTLDRFTLAPVQRPLALQYTLYHMAGGKLTLRKQLHGTTESGGIGGGELALTEDLPEGEYLLAVSDAAAAQGKAASVRTAVRRLRVDRDDQPLLIVDRKAYKPGDQIEAYFRGRRLGNAPAAPNQPVIVTAFARKAAEGADPKAKDGDKKSGDKSKDMGKGKLSGGFGGFGGKADHAADRLQLQFQTDADGNARFKIPVGEDLKDGDDLNLEVEVPDGRLNDKVKQVVPIVKAAAEPQLTAEFFPEGGDLAAGVPNRVYFRFLAPDGLPADLEAVLEDGQRRDVVPLKFAGAASRAVPNQVLGAFTFTPAAGQTYRVRLTTAGKVERLPLLPRAMPDTVSLTVPAGVLAPKEPVRVLVRDPRKGELLVLASCRGRTVDQKIVKATDRLTEVTLDPVPGANGVLRVTVYEKTATAWEPAAERLVYRLPGEYLKLTALADKVGGIYRPGETATLRAECRNETGALVPAWIHAVVLDDQGRRISGGETSPPALFLLTSELREPEDLEDADVLLTDAAAAPEALDLFLGTQGWRRFHKREAGERAQLVEAADKKDNNDNPAASAAPPVLLTAGTRLVIVFDRYERAVRQQDTVLLRETAQRADSLATDRDRAAAQADVAAAALADFEELPLLVLRYAAGASILILLAAGALLLLAGLVVAARARRSPRPLLAGAFCTLLVAAVVFLSTGALRTPPEPREQATAPEKQGRPRFAQQGEPAEPNLARDRENSKVISVVLAERGAAGADSALPKDLSQELRAATDRPRKESATTELASQNGTAYADVPLKKNRSLGMQERYQYLLEMESKDQAGGGGGPVQPYPYPPPCEKAKDDKAPGNPPNQAGPGGKGGFEGDGKADKQTRRFDSAVVLKYAHVYSPGAADVQDLVLWHPLLHATDGTARVAFDLNGQPTTYRVILYGHTAGGRLGVFHGQLQAK
jgi:hypothetical protein